MQVFGYKSANLPQNLQMRNRLFPNQLRILFADLQIFPDFKNHM